jgi:hypothetical protein
MQKLKDIFLYEDSAYGKNPVVEKTVQLLFHDCQDAIRMMFEGNFLLTKASFQTARKKLIYVPAKECRKFSMTQPNTFHALATTIAKEFFNLDIPDKSRMQFAEIQRDVNIGSKLIHGKSLGIDNQHSYAGDNFKDLRSLEEQFKTKHSLNKFDYSSGNYKDKAYADVVDGVFIDKMIICIRNIMTNLTTKELEGRINDLYSLVHDFLCQCSKNYSRNDIDGNSREFLLPTSVPYYLVNTQGSDAEFIKQLFGRFQELLKT